MIAIIWRGKKNFRKGFKFGEWDHAELAGRPEDLRHISHVTQLKLFDLNLHDRAVEFSRLNGHEGPIVAFFNREKCSDCSQLL